MDFVKMHGCANDFVITHQLSDEQIETSRPKIAELCDRRRGVGADGLAAVLPSESCDLKMRIINADGSEAEMCGNAVRCVNRYAQALGLADKPSLIIETLAGEIRTEQVGARVRVDMGCPILDAERIPVANESGRVLKKDIVVDDEHFVVSAVSMGNPHAILYARDLTDDLVLGFGKLLQTHPDFPQRANVEFVKVENDDAITMRVYERGVGETLACGTGACAGVVAGVLNGKHGRKVTVHLRGGDLEVEWDGEEAHSVFLTGPAEQVFRGTIDLE